MKLDGHKLTFELSKPQTGRKQTAQNKRVSAAPVKVKSEKLALKNIAFEATLQELKQLLR